MKPGTALAEALANRLGSPPSQETTLLELLRRPEIDYAVIAEGDADCVDAAIGQQIEIEAKYAGYIARQREEIERLRTREGTPIPPDFDYGEVVGLSNEVRQKLGAAAPDTLGRAARIPGVTPAAVALLSIFLKKRATQHQHTA